MARRTPLFLIIILALSARAEGPLYLELSSKGDRTDLGLGQFAVERGQSAEAAALIRSVVKSDLSFPKSFNVIDEDKPSKGKAALGAWANMGADLVVTAELEKAMGRPALSGVLRDVATGDEVLKKRYTVEPGGERAAAHAFADDVIRQLTGQPSVTRSRIVFVNDATGRKEVCVIDYDGAGFRRITSDRSIALFPKPSPDRKSVVFTTFKEGWPTIHLASLEGGRRRALCRYEGLNGAAAWLPDGQQLVATLSLGREPGLHVVDLEGRIVRTLTNAAAADTAPSVSPDGLQVAFTSDRPGRPQIYVMNTSGANLRRLTPGDDWCDSPAWSPQGHVIAYTASERGKNFDIRTVEVGTGRVERLTYGEGDNENAAWSPDGRWLVFTSTRRGRPELFIMGADGSLPRPLADIPGRSFTPAWME